MSVWALLGKKALLVLGGALGLFWAKMHFGAWEGVPFWGSMGKNALLGLVVVP